MDLPQLDKTFRIEPAAASTPATSRAPASQQEAFGNILKTQLRNDSEPAVQGRKDSPSTDETIADNPATDDATSDDSDALTQSASGTSDDKKTADRPQQDAVDTSSQSAAPLPQDAPSVAAITLAAFAIPLLLQTALPAEASLSVSSEVESEVQAQPVAGARSGAIVDPQAQAFETIASTQAGNSNTPVVQSSDRSALPRETVAAAPTKAIPMDGVPGAAAQSTQPTPVVSEAPKAATPQPPTPLPPAEASAVGSPTTQQLAAAVNAAPVQAGFSAPSNGQAKAASPTAKTASTAPGDVSAAANSDPAVAESGLDLPAFQTTVKIDRRPDRPIQALPGLNATPQAQPPQTATTVAVEPNIAPKTSDEDFAQIALATDDRQQDDRLDLLVDQKIDTAPLPQSNVPANSPAPAVAAANDVAAPAATSRPTAHPVVEQVVMHLSKAAADSVDRIKIELRPLELGRIDVRMEIGPDGHVQAVFAADRPQTMELLQRDSRQLERALQDAGLNVNSGSLSFDLRGNGNGNGGANRFDAPQAATWPQLDMPSELIAAGQAYAATELGAGRLDIRV